METRWYLFERKDTPGRLGVQWASKGIGENRDRFVAWFSGTLDDCIRYAEDLEQHGYSFIDPDVCKDALSTQEQAEEKHKKKAAEAHSSVMESMKAHASILPQDKKEEATQDAQPNAESMGVELVFELEDYTKEETPKKTRRHKAKLVKDESTPEEKLKNYAVDGQMSLFDVLRQ